jgi:endonuclease/exonuclease/phosphatase family metal-dependent hydrolase
MPEKISLHEFQRRLRDPDFPEQDLVPYISIDESTSTAFNPALQPNPDTVDVGQLEGAVLMRVFNRASRLRRKLAYERRIGAGATLRIVSEGDSWFQYPFLLKDVLDKVVRYRTDTEPGSSGSPVFNNSWDLVALHHAGWRDGTNTATNEGIRLAAIVSHLIGGPRRESSDVAPLLALIPDSSPYLGFFDTAGIEGDRLEVELPDFRGVPDFADVGFWNIEHFNDRVGDARIERVARVVARLSMDVLGLVEVQERALEKLVQKLRDHGQAADFVPRDLSGRQDLAVLYDTDTSEVTCADGLAQRYAQRIATCTPSGRTAFPRAPLFARCRVQDETGGPVEFLLIVVHLKAFGDATSRSQRRLAARILSEIIEDIRQREDIPVVLGGDFNDVINNDVLAALTDSPDMMALTTDDADRNAASYVGGSRRSLIDHIIISSDVRAGDIAGDDAAIIRLDRSVADFADDVSDHVPLVMRIVHRDAPIDVPDDPDGDDEHTLAIPVSASELTVSFD